MNSTLGYFWNSGHHRRGTISQDLGIKLKNEKSQGLAGYDSEFL